MSFPLRLAGRAFPPGTTTHAVLTLPHALADGQAVEIPYTVIRGAAPGKVLYVQVAQHGPEIMGLEALRRLVRGLDPRRMKGALVWCLPNPLAFRERARATRLDPVPGGMNRVWPGDSKGSLTARMAHAVWTCLVLRADAVVDLHASGRHSAAWVFYEAEGVSPRAPAETARRSEELARRFGAPYLYAELEPLGGRQTLRACCVDRGIPAIVPELGGSGHFDEPVVELARRGLRNVLADLGILPGRLALPPEQLRLRWHADRTRYTACAGVGGLFRPRTAIGARVRRGACLGEIYSPRTFEVLEATAAPQDGVVLRIREDPVVHPGDELVCVPEVLERIVNRR